MDKAILLQKQVRDNSDDLQREFLDMAAWEEQMKKKDLEIRNMKDDQVIPPVRTKKKKKTVSNNEEAKDEKPRKAKRIASSDYKSWDNFDVEKACEEVDDKSVSKDKEEKVYEIPSKEQLDKEHAEATKLKDEGNQLVQLQRYAKAVGKYSEAIKIFPHDAVFYANRALCQLKLDNLFSAVSDCTHAIKLDCNYIKAYHRRATALMELKRYPDALKDIEVILKLDPSNKEAVCMQKQVQSKIEKLPKPMVIAGEEKKHGKSSIEKKIGEKLLEKKGSTALKYKKPDEQTEDISIMVEHKHASQAEEFLKKEILKQKEDNIEKTEIETKNDTMPSWLPKLKQGINIVEPLAEIPRRLKQTLKRIPITEVPANQSIFKGVEDVKEETTKSIVQEKNVSELQKVNKTEYKISNIERSKEEKKESLPPPPKTSVAFSMTWQRNVSLDFRYKYLKHIEPKDFPDIFKESLEYNIFSEILSVLRLKFISNNDKVYDYLYHLTKVKRFRALVLFINQVDKEALKTLFEYCKIKEGRTKEEVQNLHSSYEM